MTQEEVEIVLATRRVQGRESLLAAPRTLADRSRGVDRQLRAIRFLD
jgi:hypothetical protein